MFKRVSAAAFTITVAFATAHLGSSSAVSSPAAAPSSTSSRFIPGHLRASRLPSPVTAYGGGCSAYGSAGVSSPHSASVDENAGAATSLINGFFSRNTAKNPVLPASVRYAIVLAPDPRHTNLSLIFDREMAQLVQAAQDQHYDYSSSWLPWKVGYSAPPSGLNDRQNAEELSDQRENCPGVILFRRRGQAGAETYEKGLVAFVVGEQATGGMNQQQWLNALIWIGRHAGQETGSPLAGDGVLRILGPTFTGSLPSLILGLNALYDPEKLPSKDAPVLPATLQTMFPSARVLSGSVSSCSGVQWLERELSRQSIPGQIQFGTFQENDSVNIYRLMRFLHSQQMPLREAAILSEDETAYAVQETENSPCDFPYAQNNRPLYLVFPRDISALRNAYEKQSVFEGSSVGFRDHAHPILRGDLSSETGPSEITDTIAATSGSIAAVDQEAYLYGVVSSLRTHHARYLVLRCTNPLDFLFLTRFFHRAYPQARIVTLGSDLLFRREIDTTEFRGVLSVSSYPLLPQAQHWTRITEDKWAEQNHNHLVFQGHIAEGMYLAARYTLQDRFLPAAEASRPNLFDQSLANKAGSASQVSLIPHEQRGPTPASPNSAASYPPLQMHRSFPMPDYSDPFWFHPDPLADPKFETHPSTWISAVGRDGYWPVAVVNSEEAGNLKKSGVCLENEDGLCPSGIATPEPIRPPVSTLVDLIEPVRVLSAGAQARQDDLSNSAQHYELQRPSATDSGRSFHHQLKINVPLPWIVSALLAIALLCYQIWGLIKGGVNPSDGLFSVFRISGDPACGVLLAMGCAIALTLPFELWGVRLIPSEFSLVTDEKSILSLRYLLAAIAVAFLLTLAGMAWRAIRLKRPGWDADRHFLARTLLSYIVSLAGFVALFVYCYRGDHDAVTDVSRFYRMIHLTGGVSPLLPVLLLTLGFYLWNWQAMAGSLIVAKGCPTLPRLRDESAIEGGWLEVGPFGRTVLSQPAAGGGDNTLTPENARISQKQGRKILRLAHPLCFATRVVAAPLLMLLATLICFGGTRNLPLLGLDGHRFNVVVNGILILALLFTATEALRLYSTWVILRRMLLALGRLRLRRTMCRLRPIAASSIWSVSGNVRRVQYDLLRDQLDAARRLKILTAKDPLDGAPLLYLPNVLLYGDFFARCIESHSPAKTAWSMPFMPMVEAPPDGTLSGGAPLESRMLRDVLADAVGEVCNRLMVIWAAEEVSLNLNGDGLGDDTNETLLSKDHAVRAAEEFVAYHYISFIQNIVARMRTMTLSMIFLFITVCAAISFYPFVPRTEVSVWLALNLLLIASAVAYVYAGMERDEILSYIASSTPGQLGTEFYVRLAGFLAGPLIGILTTQFPAIADTALEWLQPGLDAIK